MSNRNDRRAMKLAIRKATNLLVRAIPGFVVKHLLKSIWYQPPLQDALRYHVQPYRYDSAIPTRFDINVERLRTKRNLPGLKWDESRFVKLAGQLATYTRELSHIPLERTVDCEFWFRNGAYGDGDAASLYGMIRHFKPRRIIEVGCGFSSRVMAMACRKNREEGHPVECLHIEPYPPANLPVDKLPGALLVKKIEEVPLRTFTELETGDFLFIDTSHVLKTQGDCCYEYLEIVPSLRPGVMVHVHDVFTPYDYPEEWIFEKLFPFNEQYALECLLSNNPKIEILLPVFYLWKDHPDTLQRLFPFAGAESLGPAAFWFRTREPASIVPAVNQP
jgi:hypothetical protein